MVDHGPVAPGRGSSEDEGPSVPLLLALQTPPLRCEKPEDGAYGRSHSHAATQLDGAEAGQHKCSADDGMRPSGVFAGLTAGSLIVVSKCNWSTCAAAACCYRLTLQKQFGKPTHQPLQWFVVGFFFIYYFFVLVLDINLRKQALLQSFASLQTADQQNSVQLS